MANNPSTMREALEKLRTEIERFNDNGWISYDAWQGCDEIISNALSAPLCNSEVGTAEEQYRRHDEYCNATRNGMSGYHCDDAPRCVFCFAKWSQMPYEATKK